MKPFRKPIYAASGYVTTFLGSGRKEFDPSKPMPSFETYLKETAQGTLSQIPRPTFDEGVMGSFMSPRFINQAHIAAFLPFMVNDLNGKPCTGVEAACGTGGRVIATAVNSILAEQSNAVFAAAFEIQNSVKAIYGADILAGAAYYKGERKKGYAYFFPGIFAERAGAYFTKYGEEQTRKAMAKWYEMAIKNARHYPKAQEYHNTTEHLLALGMTPPDPERFLPYLNPYDCSKVSDGAASIGIFSKEGLDKNGIAIHEAIEIIAIGAAEEDITIPPTDLTRLANTEIAVQKAFEQSGLKLDDISLLELHDCFSISALLALEALGFAKPGKAPAFIMSGETDVNGRIPTNLSGGLCGFGHPTGASGVRQLVDLWQHFTDKAPRKIKTRTPFGMMISMGGNDKTVSCIIVKRQEKV